MIFIQLFVPSFQYERVPEIFSRSVKQVHISVTRVCGRLLPSRQRVVFVTRLLPVRLPAHPPTRWVKFVEQRAAVRCVVHVWSQFGQPKQLIEGDAIAPRSSRKGRARACRLVSVHRVLGERPSYPSTSTLCCRTYITVLCLSFLVVGASWRLMGDGFRK